MNEKVKVSCQNCGTTNFYPLSLQKKSILCGRCKHPLPLPGRILEPKPAQVHSLIQKSALPVLVEFFSSGCVHCSRMQPILEGLGDRRKGELMILNVSLDLHPEMGASFGISGVPTFMVFHKGQERGRMSGAVPEVDFGLWVANLL